VSGYLIGSQAAGKLPLPPAVAGMERLAATRRDVDRRPFTAANALSLYGGTIGHVLEVTNGVPAAIGHRQLARDLDAFVALAQASESASLERGLGAAVAIAGRFHDQEDQRLAAAAGLRQRELARFQATATPAQQELYSSTVDAPRVEQAGDLETLLLIGSQASRLKVFPEQWLEASGERVEALRVVARQLGDQAVRANRAIIVATERQLLNNLLLLMIVVVLTFALALFLARSMINPLVQLEQAARDVAERKLPSVVERLHRAEAVDLEAETRPIEVGARGEIGRVAEAFTAVQRVAVSVAVDQAALRQSVSEMFVNMARRSQSLIDRQLALIDQLEKNETDPEQLDQFFRLDLGQPGERQRRVGDRVGVDAGLVQQLGRLAGAGHARHGQLHHARAGPRVRERFQHGVTQPALRPVVLHRDDTAGGLGGLEQRDAVDRLDRIAVDHPGGHALLGQPIRRPQRLRHGDPDGHDGDLVVGAAAA
jgi:hypothetical protein